MSPSFFLFSYLLVGLASAARVLMVYMFDEEFRREMDLDAGSSSAQASTPATGSPRQRRCGRSSVSRISSEGSMPSR